jgi:hypothetical protein
VRPPDPAAVAARRKAKPLFVAPDCETAIVDEMIARRQRSGTTGALDFLLQVFEEAGPRLGMMPLNQDTPVIAIEHNALHPVSVEADNSVNRSEGVSIALAGQYAVPFHHYQSLLLL